jgi:adenine-specific DNA-methyltransferase
MNLNRADGGNRKYIVVEMGEYFNTVVLPRIKKVAYCENWKVGKPAGGEGVSHFVKYHTLEQYEDTLNNLALLREKDGEKTQQKFGDDYLLRYMLEFETQGSPCLLNLAMIKNPFDHRLKVQEGDEIVERTVDLVETFNYLIGLQVKKMRTFENDGHPYRAVLGEQNGKSVVIIWRPLNGLEEDKAALRRDKQFIEGEVLPALLSNGVKPDRLLVNGACHVENAEAIEPEFKRLMFKEIA